MRLCPANPGRVRVNTPAANRLGQAGARLDTGPLLLRSPPGRRSPIHGYWLAFPQHTTYLVVETDDITHLQKFLSPGTAVTTCEITPVSDQPAPLPG